MYYLKSRFYNPTLGYVNSGDAISIGVTGTETITVSGAQVLTGIGAGGISIMMASHNRPGNNVEQNKQFNDAARRVGLNLKDPKVKDELRELRQYIKKTN